MFTSLLLTALSKNLDSLFTNVSRATQTAGSPDALHFKQLNLNQFKLKSALSTATVINGTLADLIIRINVPSNPLAWTQASVHVIITGLSLTVSVSEDIEGDISSSNDYSVAELHKAISLSLTQALGSTLSLTSFGLQSLSWVASRTHVEILSLTISLRIVSSSSASSSPPLEATFSSRTAVLSHGASSSVDDMQLTLVVTGATLHMPITSSASSSSPSPAKSVGPLLVNPFSCHVLLSVVMRPPEDNFEDQPRVSLSSSIRVDKLEVTVVEEQLRLVCECLDGLRAHCRHTEAARDVWAWRRLLYHRRVRLRGKAGRGAMTAMERWRLVLSCLRQPSSPPSSSTIIRCFKHALETVIFTNSSSNSSAKDAVLFEGAEDFVAAVPSKVLSAAALSLFVKNHPQALALLRNKHTDNWSVQHLLSVAAHGRRALGFDRASLHSVLWQAALGRPTEWDVRSSITLSRVALSIFHSLPPQWPPAKKTVPPRPIIHGVCYGLQTLALQSTEYDELFIRVGRVCCFGAFGKPIFVCGREEKEEKTAEVSEKEVAESKKEENVVEKEDTDKEKSKEEAKEESKVEQEEEDVDNIEDPLGDCALQSQIRFEHADIGAIRRLYIEVGIAPLKILWNENAHLDFHRLCSYQSTLFTSPMPSTNDSYSETSALPLVSCDFSVQQLYIDVPLRQFHLWELRDTSMRLSLGPLAIKAGRFIDDSTLRRDLSHSDANQTFSVSLIDLKLAMCSSRETKDLVSPWTASGAVTVSRAHTIQRMRLQLSDILIDLTDKQLLNVLEVLELLSRRWIRAKKTTSPPSSSNHYRLFDSTELDINLSVLSVIVAPHIAQMRRSRHTYASLLGTFEILVSKRGQYSRVVQIHRAILERRLLALDLAASTVSRLIEEVILLPDDVKGEDAGKLALLTLGLEDISDASSSERLFSFNLTGLHFNARNAEGCTAVAAEVGEVLLLDSMLLPVLVVRGSSRDEHQSLSVGWSIDQDLSSNISMPNDKHERLVVKSSRVELRLSSDFQKFLDCLQRALMPAFVKCLMLAETFRGSTEKIPSADADSVGLISVRVNIDMVDAVLLHFEEQFCAIKLCSLAICLTFRADGFILSGSSADVELADLTEIGSLHSVVLWGKEGEGKTLAMDYDSNEREVVMRVSGMRCCLLSRFMQEAFMFYDHAVLRSFHALEAMWRGAVTAWEVPLAPLDSTSSCSDKSYDSSDEEDRLYFAYSHLVEAVVQENSPPPSEPLANLRYKMSFEDTTLYMPRNSTSKDIIALSIGSAAVSFTKSGFTWPVPCSIEERGDDYHRHFVPSANRWGFSTSEGKFLSWQTERSGPEVAAARCVASLTDCRLFSCIYSSLSRSSAEVQIPSDEYVLLAEVEDDRPVFIFGSLETGVAENSAQTWRKISEPLNLLTIVDCMSDCTRVLFSDTEKYAPLNFDLSLAEYYLLLSLYHDNLFEAEQFFGTGRHSRNPSVIAVDKFKVDYATSEYFDFFQRQIPSFEILFARESLTLHCSFNPEDHFEKAPPSQHLFASKSSSRGCSLAVLRVTRCLLHYKLSSSCSQISFNCGSVQVVDDTFARSTVDPDLLNLASSSSVNKYGYSCFNYRLVGPIDMKNLPALPLSVNSFYNCLNQFQTTVITMLSPEFCLNNLNHLWVLIDYFSLYYSSPAYGNPYSSDEKTRKLDSYGLSDIRILFMRPLILSLKEPSNRDTQYLLLESDSFIACRVMTDSSGARKVTVDGGDVALVVVRQYRESSRGLRGASGSGRGIRTIAEHLHFRVIHHIVSFPQTSDISIELYSSDTDSHDYDWDAISVPQSTIIESTCVENVDVISRSIPPKTLNIVASFEDSLLCLSILSGFLAETQSVDEVSEWSIFCVLKISAHRVVVVDNVVGLHLPLFQLLVDEVSVTLNGASFLPESSLDKSGRYNLFVGVRGFADYFNYSCKCWEPLLEPVICEVLYEQSSESRGLSLRSRSNFHVNVSGACLKAVHEMLRVVNEDVSSSAIETFGIDRAPQRSSSISQGYSPLISSNSKAILHIPSQCLSEGMRVGFSIVNATGQDLRYLVDHGEDRKVVRYLKDGQRGILNFPATQFLIRNGSVYEEAFDLQREEGTDRYEKLRRVRIGHLIGLQISGFRWIETEADVLGARYELLTPISESHNLNKIYSKEWKLLNALTLLAEVTSTAGGRLLRLRSVFEIKNKTHHRLHVLLSHEESEVEADPDNSPFTVDAGGVLYVPLALLYGSMLKSGGKELGFVRVRPAEVATVKAETGVKNNVSIRDLLYSADPISLVKLAESSFDMLQFAASGSGKYVEENLQLVCHINSELKESRYTKNTFRPKSEYLDSSAKIPPFIYNVEVTRLGAGHSQVLDVDAEKTFADMFFKQYIKRDEGELKQLPLHYQLVLQPPIVLQNLLPAIGKYTIINTVTRVILWSKFLSCGESMDIHTLSLQEPLTLLINLGYCRTTDGARIHVPLSHKEKGMASLQRTIEGFLEDDIRDKTLWLTDFVGQKLKLHIENEVGGGGQRLIRIFTPFWLINTSQYVLRFKEELSEHFPAGTVFASKDGTKSVPGGDADEFRRANVKTIFPGKPGPLTHANDIIDTDPLYSLLGELSAESILQFAFMFNFNQGQRRMMVQLDDSSWSRPFSLDSVGVHQELSIEREETGNLEVGFRIDLAPGVYGKYTRIVRFSPRFVIVNALPHNVTMCQPTGVVGEYDSSFAVMSNHRKAFHLPCVFGKRKLGVQLEGQWTRSVMFSVDMTGEFTLLVRKEVNLASLEHIVTRPARFNVWLPSQELGVWFETDWKQQEIVVKAMRAGLYASNFTEIQVGDVLLSVNGIKAEGKNFDTIMHLLKKSNRGLDVSMGGQQYAEFMSSEEKLAKIRRDAVVRSQNTTKHETAVTDRTIGVDDEETEIAVKITVHIENATMFIAMRPVETGTPPEYLIVNRSPSHSIVYKQKGMSGNRWLEIDPGDSRSYFWEHPLMKQRALLVQLGKTVLVEQEVGGTGKGELQKFGQESKNSQQSLSKVERLCLSIFLDDIGQVTSMSTNDPILGKLILRIFIRGPTKVLEISPEVSSIPSVLKYCEDMISEQQRILGHFKASLVNSALLQTAGPSFESRMTHNLKMMHDSLRSFQKSCFDGDSSIDEGGSQYVQYQQSHIAVFGTII